MSKVNNFCSQLEASSVLWPTQCRLICVVELNMRDMLCHRNESRRALRGPVSGYWDAGTSFAFFGSQNSAFSFITYFYRSTREFWFGTVFAKYLCCSSSAALSCLCSCLPNFRLLSTKFHLCFGTPNEIHCEHVQQSQKFDNANGNNEALGSSSFQDKRIVPRS